MSIEHDAHCDIDVFDLGTPETCVSGPYLPQVNPACEAVLLDGDADVGQDDVASSSTA